MSKTLTNLSSISCLLHDQNWLFLLEIMCFSFPLASLRLYVPQEKVIPCLLRLKQASDPGLRAAVREALALVGYHTPVKGRGIRILSIDGGGLRYKFYSFSYLIVR